MTKQAICADKYDIDNRSQLKIGNGLVNCGIGVEKYFFYMGLSL